MTRRGWLRIGCVAAATAFVVAAAGPPARSDATAPPFEYVRSIPTMEGVVRSALARSKGCDATLFVFDAATFDPPPGRSEFDEQHRYAGDLPAWITAIRAACPPAAPRAPGATGLGANGDGRGVFVAATTSKVPIEVGLPKWEALVGGELHAGRWDDRAFREFEPAQRWTARLLGQIAGPRRSLVLVTGDVPPEDWIRRPPFRATAAAPFAAEPWRRKLSEVGAYWDAEKVGSAVAAAGARLIVVAPEARFGDFLPLEEIPQAPWASRPQAMDVAGAGGGPEAGTTPGDGDDGSSLSEDAIRKFEEQMRAQGVPEEVIRAAIDKLRSRSGGPKGGAGGPQAHDAPRSGGRFTSMTPLWFPLWGQQRFFNADSPSGYGAWPLARAAAIAGGAYCFYPFPPAPWLDVCPRDASLVDALAPELVPQDEFARLRSGDEALAAMLAAQRIVLDSTPWMDGSRGFTHGGASSWCGFEPGNGPAARWRAREKPWDAYGDASRSVRSWKTEGRKLAAVVADYDRAIRVLAEAQEQLAAGKLAGTTRRSQANLRLCRLWFEMSAFHLDALRLYLTELDRFMPPGADDREVLITYTQAFRMSDCLDAYDGRTISAADELRRGHLDPPGAFGKLRGYQGNFLAVPFSDPDYRAKRDLDDVFFRLDPRLLPRALRIVEGGRDVMAHEARSGWGWVTYYAEVLTFVWTPTPKSDGREDRHGDPDEPPAPPHTPGSGGGTSPGTPK